MRRRGALAGVLLAVLAALLLWWATRPGAKPLPPSEEAASVRHLPPAVPPTAPGLVPPSGDDPLAATEDPEVRYAAVRHLAEASGRTYVECPAPADENAWGLGCGRALCTLDDQGGIAFVSDQPSGALGVHHIIPGHDDSFQLELAGRMVWETDVDGVTTCAEQPIGEELWARVQVVRPDGSPAPRVSLSAHDAFSHSTR